MMIDIKNLHKKFKEIHALKGISLQVQKGEIYGFIGKNGAGKSTTMNIMAGLSRPLSGSCVINGRDISKVKHPGDLSIGYLPESPAFYNWLTARESLTYLQKSGTTAGQPGSDNKINEMLSWVGLEKAAGRRVGGFSRGMKQRLGLCQILMHEPELLILDEPSSALDPEGRSDILRLIKELNQMGKTIIFSTHILSDVERICDTVGMIADGRMLMQKPLTELLDQNIELVFDLELIQPLTGPDLEALKALPGILGALLSESGKLAVTVHDETSGSAAIIAWADHRRIPLRSLSPRRQSLEDLFIQEVNTK